MSRQTKLTNKSTELLRQALMTGISYASACSYAGFSYSAFAAWRAEAYRERGPDEPPLPYALIRLREMLDEVSAELEKLRVADLTIAAKTEWQAAAWFLERRYPEHWGRHRLKWEPQEISEQGQRLIIEYVESQKSDTNQVTTNGRDPSDSTAELGKNI